ncbi:hypothetical protein H310_03434 [Aphanomyces invadans]|uniref:B box-type domain-containing protein n=1 Tax=Aphanomyces invadans TaxID=157072 RepID=A0A024UHG5_9STRA|nr:hypothetical protein H310_03434 [Aphanomyces invadans]ETW05734.1 hypothetical protein H310_03434 [Aphanomyces invadans]|eukprot:XP_008865511.1 hypothetical protein H310_03434 [Aphanomyces invadans]
MKRRPPPAEGDAMDLVGTFTKMALDIEKCQKYNPALWETVLKRSTKRLETYATQIHPAISKARKRARGQASTSSTPVTFPAVSVRASSSSLSSYLDQPDMVREMLHDLHQDPSTGHAKNSRLSMTTPSLPTDTPPLISRPPPIIPLSPTASSSPTKLPILTVITPRTRQWVARLPPPREADWVAINQLESVADDTLARRGNSIDNMDQPHSLYGMLQRRKWPKKTHRPSSQYRREAAARYSAVSSPTKDAVNSNVGSVLDLERISDEAKLMQQHDFDVKVSSGNLSTIIHEVSLYDSFDDLELDKIEATIAVDPSGDDILFTNDECLQTAAIPAPSPPTSPPRRRQHVLLELDHRASVIESEVTVKAHENAVAAVDATLASIQKFVPLELIYAHGKGRYASMQIQRAMQLVYHAMLRLAKRQYLVVWSRWQRHTSDAREAERWRCAVTVQCAWRQVLARREVAIRRRLRKKQLEREKNLLQVLLARKNDAAACITRHLRRYVGRCRARQNRKRHVAALRIQRFFRRRHALWARFARFLQHRRETVAAICIQKHVRAHLGRAKTRLVRKLRAVDRRKALLMAHVEARAHALRVVGAALTVQRNFRRRQIARRAKFGAMRRRHAKKVVAAVKVQSIARMYLAMNELRRMRTTYPTAALVIQCAVRRHQSTRRRLQLLQAVREDRKRRVTKKKELRREKRQRQKARAHANQATKLWMALQDTASTVQKQRLKWMQMEPPQAAMCIQGGWKGYKTRKRLARQFAKDKERDRRLANRSRRVAATCIQRHVRGMLGRKRFWFALMTKYATSIQRLFRNRKARRDIAIMRAYVKAARLIQTRWLNKKEFVQFRRHRRAAVAIQSVVRMWLDKKRFVQRVEAFHRRLEVRLVGQVLFAQRTLDVVQTQLLQLSWQFATHTAADTAVTKKHYQPSPMLAAAASGNVQRALYSRDADGMWTTMGCFGLWQTIYLDVCRHGNTPDAVEIDNMRFSRFLKGIPGMLHKSLCPLHHVDVVFAKFKPAKGRTMPFAGFHNAMSYLLTLRYPDKATALTMEQRFLTFMHELVLVSKFGEAYRLNLAALAMERASWAAHVIQSMCRRRQQLKRHQAFVGRFLEKRRQNEARRAATLLQNKWRQRLAKLGFQALVCDTFVEYVDWKSGACSYKNLVTNTTTYSRPALLRGLTPSISIRLPPPGEGFIVNCCRHDTQPPDLATMFCMACEEAMCGPCFARDHKANALANHSTVQVQMCRLCSKHTASRVCNQCQGGTVPYCDTCYPHYHKDKFACHTFTPLVCLCVECGEKVGRWRCTTCTDLFCKKCFSNFHRKGQRQNHGMEPVPYLAVEAKAAQDLRRREKEQQRADMARAEEVARQVEAIELQKREVAAVLIQTAYRAKRGRVEGKAYMKEVRHTNRMVQQRLKDDVVRSAFTYKLRKVVGLAPTLASDTVDEVHAAQQRKDNVVAALGWATYDYTKGPPEWCCYNARVDVLDGEFKSFQATVVSTTQVVTSGLVMVHVTAANKSTTLPLAALRPTGNSASPSKVLQLAETVGHAAHKMHVTMLDRIDRKRQHLKLLHHRTEFKDLEEYAWVELPANNGTPENPSTWWNVVNNCKTTTMPNGVKAMESMDPSAREDMLAQIQEAHEKLVQLQTKSERRRRGSVDTAFSTTDGQAIEDALFWQDSLWSHPRVGKTARQLVKELSTTDLRGAVQLLRRVKTTSNSEDVDADWEKIVLKFCALKTLEKKELLAKTVEMHATDARVVLWSLVDPNAAKAQSDTDD